MKPVRWGPHALDNLAEREIDRAEVERTLEAPQFSVPGRPPRAILMRRYRDSILGREMLLRVVVEDTMSERVVVTVYKTSQIAKYLKGLAS